jgi:hypothetical protein
MDELIKLVTDKVGISEAQARQAIETVMNFLKDKLPIADQLDDLLKGVLGSGGGALGSIVSTVTDVLDGDNDGKQSGGAGDLLGGMSDMIGGLLGGDKKDER